MIWRTGVLHDIPGLEFIKPGSAPGSNLRLDMFLDFQNVQVIYMYPPLRRGGKIQMSLVKERPTSLRRANTDQQ